MELVRKLSVTCLVGMVALGLACSKKPAAETPAAEIPATVQETAGVFPAVGSTAKEVQLKDLDGNVVKLSDFSDKTVLVDFWATWCGDCARVAPGLKKLHGEYSDQGFEILGIDCWEREGGDPVGYAREHAYPWKILLEGDEAAELYSVKAIPAMFLIHKGKITYTSVEEGPDLAGLGAAIKTALSSQ